MVDTITIYRSPVRLVLHASEATSPFSPQAISRARKKMMAEIALGGDEVVIDGISYSRNDAATLLDNISEDVWRVHCLIYTFPGLLQFLETQAFNDEELKKADAYLYDQRFVSVVSPWFAYSFNAASGAAIRQANFSELLLLLNYKGYILPEHEHEAFQKIRTYLDELSYTLRNLSWEKFIEDESILHFVFDEAWQKSMNALPLSFNTLRDEIVEHLIQIVLRFQQKATWYYLHQVLVNLRQLDTNDFNRHEITRIDEVIYENTRIESRGGKRRKDDEVSTGRIVWWGVWVVLMFIRIATCNTRSSNYSYDSSSYSYTSPAAAEANVVERSNEKKLVQKLDSLLQGKPRNVRVENDSNGNAPFAFTEDTKVAKNDSLFVVNNTGYDAVFLYFKDMPGHALAGHLPKIYANLIRKGESKTVYLVPDNGRVYFAFGESWGKLQKPISLPFDGLPVTLGDGQQDETLFYIDHFFRSTKGIRQTYLQQPLVVSAMAAPGSPNNEIKADNLQQRGNDAMLFLTTSESGFRFESRGRLHVRAEGRN